jgi:S-adenosylmethionine-diacylglycerol 3-amino-3-carboxypropyl transferase
VAAYFKYLNYTLGDEDAQTEMDMLAESSQHVFAIADCGSRIVPLLARAPRKLTCVDINPDQLAVTRLRIALLHKVDRDVYCKFLGYTHGMTPQTRQRLFANLDLEDRHGTVLKEMLDRIHWGPLVYEGKFERMLITLSKVTRAVLGNACDRLFEQGGVKAQAAYFRRGFPRLRWMLLLALLGNSTALNSLLYKGDFPEKNIPKSYLRIYSEIFERLLTQFPARSSFFLQLIFLGTIRFEQGLPVECRPDVYARAQARLKECEVHFLEGDVMSSFGATGGDIDYLSLSDVPSFLLDEAAAGCLQLARPYMRKGGLAVIRSHVRLVRPLLDRFRDDSHLFADVASHESTGLWHIQAFRAV